MKNDKDKITTSVRVRKKFFKIIKKKSLKFSEIIDIALEKELAERGLIVAEMKKEDVVYE